MNAYQVIEMMTEAKNEQQAAIKKLKSNIKTGNADPENYDSLRSVISERFAAKMEVLEQIGELLKFNEVRSNDRCDA
jgi:hypothetical protein